MQKLRKISNKELKNILELHKKWLNNEEDGERADLSYVDLVGVDLSYTDLTGANLSYADLTDANLKRTKLRDADLTKAILIGANLTNCNLYNTKLLYAKIDNMISIGNLGDNNRIAYYFYKEDRVICDYFDGTLEEFEEAVSKKYDKDSNYYVAINTFKNLEKLLVKNMTK